MRLLVFGLGFSALHFVREHRARFSGVVGTVRSREKAEALAGQGISARVFGPDGFDQVTLGDIAEADAVLVSAPPGPDGDPVLARLSDAVAAAPRLAWIGYLSTIGVYGDHGGAWVDETAPPTPTNPRAAARVAAERAWLGLGERSGKAVQAFRLSGIYGPGRNQLQNLRAGTARRLVKPGQVFNRIHVDDIAGALMASLDRPRGGAIYNVTDDEPAPPQDVIAYAAALMGVEPPPEIPFETAELTPMARSFYGDNKRVSNRLVREELGMRFRHPTYREGLRSLWEAGEGR